MKHVGEGITRLRIHTEPENQNTSERRYDARTQQKVIALASRLQDERRETLTAQEMEDLGQEVGLEPHFIRQALAQLPTKKRAETQASLVPKPPAGSRTEFRSVLIAFLLPLIWGILARIGSPNPVLAQFYTLISPPALACLQGFLTGKKRVGLAAALALIASLLPTTAVADYGSMAINSPALFFLFFIAPLAALLGVAGAWTRQRYFPFPSAAAPAPPGVSRPELLHLLSELQTQWGVGKGRYAFLSVETVGSASGAASEQFRRWVEETIAGYGGTVQTTPDGGLICLFLTDAAAVKAAHHLVSLPLRIRCGLSAGETADRAVALGKRAGAGTIAVEEELRDFAERELGPGTALPQAGGETIFAFEPNSA